MKSLNGQPKLFCLSKFISTSIADYNLKETENRESIVPVMSLFSDSPPQETSIPPSSLFPPEVLVQYQTPLNSPQNPTESQSQNNSIPPVVKAQTDEITGINEDELESVSKRTRRVRPKKGKFNEYDEALDKELGEDEGVEDDSDEDPSWVCPLLISLFIHLIRWMTINSWARM